MDRSDEREFTQFVAERAHALLGVAYALTGDRHAADDLVLGALAKAFARWRHIHGAGEPYVRRVIYHDHVSAWRADRRREYPVADLPGRPTGDAPATELREALRALPPKQRAVLVLRYLEDPQRRGDGRDPINGQQAMWRPREPGSPQGQIMIRGYCGLFVLWVGGGDDRATVEAFTAGLQFPGVNLADPGTWPARVAA